MEMAWWLLGAVLFSAFGRAPTHQAVYALAAVGWYGFGRFWLEPLREKADMVGER